jgi:hypothetical protein
MQQVEYALSETVSTRTGEGRGGAMYLSLYPLCQVPFLHLPWSGFRSRGNTNGRGIHVRGPRR